MSQPSTRPGFQQVTMRIVDERWWSHLVTAVIILNALTIAVSTYPVPPRVLRWLEVVDAVCMGFFVFELLVRLAAVKFNPRRFFTNGWNIFDFIVIIAGLTPWISSNTTALRVVRLLRVSRLLRLMPDVKVLLNGLRKAAGPAFSLLMLTLLYVYLYAVIGWMMFSGRVTDPEMPKYFDNIGEAMLTLFELLTLEGWNETMRNLRDLHPLSLPYVISFVVFGTYIVVNLVVGIIINSLDGAYEERKYAEMVATVKEHGDTPEKTLYEIKELMAKLEAQVMVDLPEDEQPAAAPDHHSTPDPAAVPDEASAPGSET
ncbi:ion transporter [Enemella sp. A6]|uniref:ion transporter n=1 Tax=Enemella sp. A6 TaxID=3440152 RepID=UPI003EBBB983